MNAVIACISFGLGNQLFQFAAGYELSKRINAPLDLDVTWYSSPPTQTEARQLLLPRIVPNFHFRRIVQYSRLEHIRDRLIQFGKFGPVNPVRHGLPVWRQDTHGQPELRTLTKPMCIMGVPVRSALESEFLDEILEILSDGVQKASNATPPDDNCAFLHVRLGDFATSEKVRSKVTILTAEYYAEGMRRYENTNGKKTWVLLSDDIKGALEIVPKGYDIFPGDGASEFDDLKLMLNSRGGVIANSSFSLWGALMCARSGGAIVAPSVWRRDGTRTPRMPDDWIIL